EAAAPDQARPGDGNILKSFTPDQRVVPVIVAVILIRLELAIGLGIVIAPAAGAGRLARQGRVCCDKDGALGQVKMNAALETDGKAQKVSCGKKHRAAAGPGASVYGTVDGQGVQR